MKIKSLTNIFWLLKNQRQIKNWRKRNFTPPSPEFIKHKIIENNNLDNSAWIETGTYYGETTKILSNISKKTVSIEADKDLYELAKKKLSNFKNVELIVGKSEDILSDAIEAFKILKKEGLIFFDDFLQHDKDRALQSYEGIEKFITLYSDYLKIEYFQNNLVVRKK